MCVNMYVHTDSFLLYIVWAVTIGNEPRLRLYLMAYINGQYQGICYVLLSHLLLSDSFLLYAVMCVCHK